MYTRFKLVTGDGWILLDGIPQGQTQLAIIDNHYINNSTSNESSIGIWDHPIDIHYSTSTLTGWPQIIFTLWKQDSYQRNEIAGYGCLRIPTCPGIHTLEIPLWRPEGTWYQEWANLFLNGGIPYLTDTTCITNPQGTTKHNSRHRLATVSAGMIMIELQVLCKGFMEHGVIMNHNE